MEKVTIKNVECYGSLKDADCILVSTCEDSFTITPDSNWTATVKNLLQDEYMKECANSGELQLEVA